MAVDHGDAVRLEKLRGVEAPTRGETAVDDDVEVDKLIGDLADVEAVFADVDLLDLVVALAKLVQRSFSSLRIRE